MDLWRRFDIAEDMDRSLPDNPRLGLVLILAGVTLGLMPFAWSHFGPGSFERASDALFRWERNASFLFSRYRRPEASDLPTYIVWLAVLCVISGAFILARRRFGWMAGEADDGKSINLDLK